MAQWMRGETDDLEWLQGWCATLRKHVAAGKAVRRARIVSEPLSEYQRWREIRKDALVLRLHG